MLFVNFVDVINIAYNVKIKVQNNNVTFQLKDLMFLNCFIYVL